jgi:hypothetical protein
MNPAPIKPTITADALEKLDMLFDLGLADGIAPVLVTPETPVPDGTRAG